MRKFIAATLLIVTITFGFFLMFLGILHIFEVNDYFWKSDDYQIIKQYCEPKGFFGWGLDCDMERWIEDNPTNYINDLNITFNISVFSPPE